MDANNLPYPKSVGFIVTNEFCERFSFYGMKAILSLYLRSKLGYSVDDSTIIYHVFTMFAYFFPLIGAIIADAWLGRFRTILYLSIVYACGSVLISVTAMPPVPFPPVAFTLIALLLIAFGTGGIKPCVSAFGGDQFILPQQEKYLGYFFSLFYFAINAGSLISTFITPILRADVKCFGDNDCYSLAFGVPGVLMVVSILIFIIGKKFYKIRNPTGNIVIEFSKCVGYAISKKFKKNSQRVSHWLDRAGDKFEQGLIDDIKAVLRVLVLYVPLPVFWALFDQQGSRWTFQADRMNQNIGSFELKPDQLQVLNPLLILVFIPLFQVAIYPCLSKIGLVTKPLHKMIVGGLLAALAFAISGIVELALLPSYGTPVSSGLAQLRVFNGFNCELNLTTSDATVNISSLSMYEKLDIAASNSVYIPYSISGSGDCANINFTGTFSLFEKTANSYFVNNEGVYGFMDNNDKAIDGVNVRFLSNVKTVHEILIQSGNRTVLKSTTNDREQHTLAQGKYFVTIGGQIVLMNIPFEAGAVYTVNVYEDVDGTMMAKPEQITPSNSLHVLWLVPQYVVITLGEVMFSVTGLEFSFTQAPTTMKSVLQSAWLLTVAFGNLLVVLVVKADLLDAQWKEFFLFSGLMLVVMVIFSIMAFRYKYVDVKSSREELDLTETKVKELNDKENVDRTIMKNNNDEL